MRCTECRNGELRAARRPKAAQSEDRVAVVTDVPVEECASCGEIWYAEEVAVILDGLLTEMLETDKVAIRPYPQTAPSAA